MRLFGRAAKLPLSSAMRCAHLCPPSPASSASSLSHQSNVNIYWPPSHDLSFELHADTRILKPLERSHRDFVAEAIPKLKPIERLCKSRRLVAKRLERQPPDHGAVLRQHMKTKRAS